MCNISENHYMQKGQSNDCRKGHCLLGKSFVTYIVGHEVKAPRDRLRAYRWHCSRTTLLKLAWSGGQSSVSFPGSGAMYCPPCDCKGKVDGCRKSASMYPAFGGEDLLAMMRYARPFPGK